MRLSFPVNRHRSVVVRALRALALAFPVVVGCGGIPDGAAIGDPVSVDASPIVHGSASRGRDPAVVGILVGDRGLCSGSLIAPDLVLTARHCVSITTESVSCPSRTRHVQVDRAASELRIVAGDSLRSGEVIARGAALVTESSTSLCGNDVAVIVLDRALATPKPLGLSSDRPSVGTRIRAVGFGIGEATRGAGQKRVREHVVIRALDAGEFDVGEATCSGDSGGPAVDEASGTVLGVVSRGTQPCDAVDARNTYSRVDAHAALFARAVVHPLRASRVGIARSSASPASDVGESCAHASDCATSICMHDANGAYCTRACGGGDRCPKGYRCRATGESVTTHACQRVTPSAP
jgi:hypothetical protein